MILGDEGVMMTMAGVVFVVDLSDFALIAVVF